MRTPHRIATAGLAACLSLAIVGCGNTPQAAAPPPVAATDPTPSTTPTTPGAILGYTPKNDDERAILQQYDAFNEMEATVHTYPYEQREKFMTPMVEQKFISNLMDSLDELDRENVLQRGKPVSHAKSITVNGIDAQVSVCADNSKVEFINTNDNKLIEYGGKQVPFVIKLIKDSKEKWLVSGIKEGGVACK